MILIHFPVLAGLEDRLPSPWRCRSGRRERQRAGKTTQTIFLTTLRPCNKFTTLRGVFRRSLRAGANSCTTFTIFEHFFSPGSGLGALVSRHSLPRSRCGGAPVPGAAGSGFSFPQCCSKHVGCDDLLRESSDKGFIAFWMIFASKTMF